MHHVNMTLGTIIFYPPLMGPQERKNIQPLNKEVLFGSDEEPLFLRRINNGIFAACYMGHRLKGKNHPEAYEKCKHIID